MPEPYPIRPVSPDELDAFQAVNKHAFHGRAMTDKHRDELIRQFEFDRSLAALEDGVPVGIAGAWTFRLCVPGAMAPAAGVTWVAVLPTHRRRGILSSLMRRQLADIAERGEAIAVLWSSEAAIYGRYGYGPATWQAILSLRRGEGELSREAAAAVAAAAGTPGGLRLRIAGPEPARAELGKVYDAVLPTRPGMFARDEHWWDRALGTTDDPDSPPVRCVIAEDASGPRGYALYVGKIGWDEDSFLADSSLEIREMMPADPLAAAALWGDLLSRDLVTTFTAGYRPADDPLWHLLADPRRMRPKLSDAVWARLVDLPQALTQRRYSCPLEVVIDVRDKICPGNQGKWRLATSGAAGSDGTAGSPGLPATCERTSAPADVALDVSSLGAAYLGGTRLGSLADAGLITEHRQGALAALSTAMSWDPPPWCPTLF